MEKNLMAPPEMSVTADQLANFTGTPQHDVSGEATTSAPAKTPIIRTQEEEYALHNAACLKAAEASMRAQNYLNYTNMKKLMPEPAMVSMIADTLTEAKAADQLARYDFGAMPLFLAKLKDLTFLELVDLSRRVNNEVARWNGCKTALECIADMKLGDSNNRTVMMLNSMAHFGYNGTQEEFSKDYTEKMEQLKNISAVLTAHIESKKEGLGTTSFTTREMIALMEKRASEIEVQSADKSALKYSNHVIEIFKDRTNFTFLKNRLQIYLKTNKKDIKRAITEMKGSTMPKCMKILTRIFGNDTMYRVWYTLIMNHIDHDADAVFVLLSFLAKLTETEKNTGNAVWAKVFILNISDCQRKVFDLEDPSEYIEKVWSNFHTLIDQFLYNNKINSRIQPGYNYTFKLEQPEEYVNAISEFEETHNLRWLQDLADERQAAIDDAMKEMKAMDGLNANDEPTEDGDESTGVSTDPESFASAQIADVAKRAEAAGISMDEISAAMTPEQKEMAASVQDEQSCGRGSSAPYVYEAPSESPEEGPSESEAPTKSMSDKLEEMKIPNA